jgi:hypothetical protein
VHKACPLSELTFGEDGNTMVIESDEAPNLLPGPTPEGHV